MSSEQLKNELKKATVDSVDRFTLEGIKTFVKIVSVYDGDTCDVVFHRRRELVRYKCRLEDLDAPELKEGIKGMLARDYLAHLCLGYNPEMFDDTGIWNKQQLQTLLDKNRNLVYAVFGEFDKYGRLLVTLKTCPKGRSINEMMEEYVENLESE